jgi:hypothetical protein
MTSARAHRLGTQLAAIAAVGFFFNVHIVLRDDESGKMSARYAATPISSVDTERYRFNSADTDTVHVQINDGVAGVRVEFKDVRGLPKAPELTLSSVELGPIENGVRTLKARIRGPEAEVSGPTHASVRVTLPGDVVQSTGQRQSSRSVLWSVPIAQFFTQAGIEIEATYRTKFRARPVEAAIPQAPSS